jgi:hypothetical protein
MIASGELVAALGPGMDENALATLAGREARQDAIIRGWRGTRAFPPPSSSSACRRTASPRQRQ